LLLTSLFLLIQNGFDLPNQLFNLSLYLSEYFLFSGNCPLLTIYALQHRKLNREGQAAKAIYISIPKRLSDLAKYRDDSIRFIFGRMLAERSAQARHSGGVAL
jgi:hypothetical protein